MIEAGIRLTLMGVTAATMIPQLFVVSQICVAKLTVQRLRHVLRALNRSLHFGRIHSFILLGVITAA